MKKTVKSDKALARRGQAAEKKAARLEAREKMREQKRAAKKPLSQKELARREKRRARRGVFLIRAGLTLLAYFGILLFIGGCIFVSIWLTKQNSDTVVTTRVSVADGESSERLRVLSENSASYLPLSFLEKYSPYVHAGDYSSRTIRFVESGDSARFFINSPFCIINGVQVKLESPVLLRGGELYLPLDFYQNYVTGIEVSGEKNRFEIAQTTDALGYKIKLPVPSDPIPEEAAGSLLEFVTHTPEFVADLAAYERYMAPGDTEEYLVLVNLQNSISETYRPNDLTGVEDRNAAYPGGDYHAKLRLFAAKALDAMIEEARANGYAGLQATSGYRGYAEQRYRFNNMVSSLMSSEGLSQAAAEEEATKSVQKPGYSEYQTGLCADVRYPNEPIDSFKDTEAAGWLAENCYQFGFILRYPEGKESSTGMESQSWHFRYVGRYHATRIMLLDMSLEEYYAFMGLDEQQ